MELLLGKTWVMSIRCLISVLTCLMGLFDQIFFRCPMGNAANAVRSGSVSHSMAVIVGNGVLHGGGGLMVGVADGFGAGLDGDRGDNRVDGFRVRRAQRLGDDVTGEVDPAALPAGVGQDGFESGVDVVDDQCNLFGMLWAGGVETALTQASEELGPEVG